MLSYYSLFYLSLNYLKFEKLNIPHFFRTFITEKLLRFFVFLSKLVAGKIFYRIRTINDPE
jgi:hypothetical protein